MVSPGQWWCSSGRWRPAQHSQRACEQWRFGRGGETCKRVLVGTVGTCALGRAKLGAVRTENWEVWLKLDSDIATFLPLIFMSLAMAISQGGPQSHREPEAEQGQSKELSLHLLPQSFPNNYGSVLLSCPVEKRLFHFFLPDRWRNHEAKSPHDESWGEAGRLEVMRALLLSTLKDTFLHKHRCHIEQGVLHHDPQWNLLYIWVRILLAGVDRHFLLVGKLAGRIYPKFLFSGKKNPNFALKGVIQPLISWYWNWKWNGETVLVPGRKQQYYGVANNTFLLLFGLMLVFLALLCYKYLLHKRKMGCSKGWENHNNYLGFSSFLSSPESRKKAVVWL